jgi:hypothetical protein
MIRSTPQRWNWIRISLFWLSAAALGLMPAMARAQENAGRPPHGVGAHGGMHPRPAVAMPRVRPIVPAPTPRAAPVVRMPKWPANAGRFASGPRIERSVQPVRVLRAPNPARPTIPAPIFFRPFSFGVLFPDGFHHAGYVSQSGEVPLGFGLWPACDSANIPGVFWTVGPCFGLGDYSAESTVVAASANPSANYLPLFFGEERGPGAAARLNPSPPAPAPTMALYLTDGSSIGASDWWVARGRLQYITTSGTTGSMDLSQLDLEQTIQQNEKRGLDFHLRFTPPSDRPQLGRF